MRWILSLTLPFALVLPVFAQPDLSLNEVDGTQPLVLDEPLDVVMVRGINYFAERELADSPNRRAAKWNRDYSSAEAYEKSVEANRQRLREIIGAVDERTANPSPFVPALKGEVIRREPHDARVRVSFIRWQVLPGVTAEGYILFPDAIRSTRIILVPDADTTPEQLAGLDPSVPESEQLGLRLALRSYTVLIPTLINRSDEFSGHPDVRFTNQPHREFLYRMSFEMGRHIIGYEVQKLMSAVDWFQSDKVIGGDTLSTDEPESSDPNALFQVLIAGIGEGGLLALDTAALDPRIDGALICGYFGQRENVWREPIYRNVWSQLTEFGDAELASLIAPRPLVIEACAVPEVAGPPAVRDGRGGGAAPGRIENVPIDSVKSEVERARTFYEALNVESNLELVDSGDAPGGVSDAPWKALFAKKPKNNVFSSEEGMALGAARDPDGDLRQQRQVDELNRFTQRLLHSGDKARDKVWAKVDRTSLDTATPPLDEYREWVYDTLIGRLPEPTMPLNLRTRKVIDEPTHVGYEVVLDLYPAGEHERPMPAGADKPLAVDQDFFAVGDDWGVIAGGILLIPRDIKPGEQRPVVVCQHGLEGTPMSTIADESHPDYHYYKGFATELCRRGFITYAPQNPYRGTDAFRQIQRKSNPMGRSLYSYIIPQHQQTLEFLAALPYVDPQRIGFYGLSYGGKTAVRVPPFLVSKDDTPGYALSICSADYDDWVRKNASSEDKYSYVFYGEYEIFEWNMGHVANYAELSYLMTPRPFMVERGHDDGVAPDEWVAWEFAKVQRHYDKLGIGDRTELEVFNGPHTINGQDTYAFLHRHLNWPAPRK